MLKLSRLSDYAVVVLIGIEEISGDNEPISASFISRHTHLPEPTVAKVLKLLSLSGLVKSVRGINGGYKLDRMPQSIRIRDIIESVDGPIALTSCVETAQEECDFARHCKLNGRWDRVNDAIIEALEKVTLKDMMNADVPSKTIKQTGS